MLIGNIIHDGLDLLSRQLKFYCWHYKRDLDQRQQQELIDILREHYFDRLADKIRELCASNIADCKQQIAKLLFEQCLISDRRLQLIQLLESDLVDINVRLDNYGRTLLHRMAYNLDVELIKVLIECGVNVRLRDYAGNTALHIAIQSYRNGSVIYNNDEAVVQNLTQIIHLLLDADKRMLMAAASKSQDSNQTQSDASCSKSQSGLLKRNSSGNKSKSKSKSYLCRGAEPVRIHDISHYRDMTLCRMLGSHCMCNANVESVKKDLELAHAMSNSGKVPETTTRDANGLCCSILTEEIKEPLVDVRNAFGRTALHYCVLVVNEHYVDSFVELLLAYGASPDLLDTRLKSPLYCLIKRPGVVAIRAKCRAIQLLIDSGCDDLGLTIEPNTFNENLIEKLEADVYSTQQEPVNETVDQIFVHNSFQRVPTLKHLARLKLIKINDELNGRLCRQMSFKLPDHVPSSLNFYVNRKVLDQSELF